MVAVLDEGSNGRLQVVVFQKDAVLKCLVPARDLALRLGMVGRTAHVILAIGLKLFGEIARDITRTVIAEQPRPVPRVDAVAA